MIAESIRIETDEDGFHMRIETTEDSSVLDFYLPDPEALYDHVKAAIGPWLYEREQASRQFRAQVKAGAFRCNPDESAGQAEAYDLSDPKHPRYHSTHADIWDARERGA